jgi:hypothetical protein
MMRNMNLQSLLKGLRIYDLEDNKNNKDLKLAAKEMLSEGVVNLH